MNFVWGLFIQILLKEIEFPNKLNLIKCGMPVLKLKSFADESFITILFLTAACIHLIILIQLFKYNYFIVLK